jgi:hypothetical protein
LLVCLLFVVDLSLPVAGLVVCLRAACLLCCLPVIACHCLLLFDCLLSLLVAGLLPVACYCCSLFVVILSPVSLALIIAGLVVEPSLLPVCLFCLLALVVVGWFLFVAFIAGLSVALFRCYYCLLFGLPLLVAPLLLLVCLPVGCLCCLLIGCLSLVACWLLLIMLLLFVCLLFVSGCRSSVCRLARRCLSFAWLSVRFACLPVRPPAGPSSACQFSGLVIRCRRLPAGFTPVACRPGFVCHCCLPVCRLFGQFRLACSCLFRCCFVGFVCRLFHWPVPGRLSSAVCLSVCLSPFRPRLIAPLLLFPPFVAGFAGRWLVSRHQLVCRRYCSLLVCLLAHRHRHYRLPGFMPGFHAWLPSVIVWSVAPLPFARLGLSLLCCRLVVACLLVGRFACFVWSCRSLVIGQFGRRLSFACWLPSGRLLRLSLRFAVCRRLVAVCRSSVTAAACLSSLVSTAGFCCWLPFGHCYYWLLLLAHC